MRDNTVEGVMSGSPKSLEGRNSEIPVQMEQVRSPSASTQRVDANGMVA